MVDKPANDLFDKLTHIMDSHTLTPVIVNPNSRFVVITYWWGSGNQNKNTQLPCPETILEDPSHAVKSPPITFNEMIESWKETCKRANCNYLVQEYPEFAVKGGYQLAINAKPMFIQKALQACGGRAVVYIDGDMTVNKYPHLFDIENVDFMARGWNIDPRSSIRYLHPTRDICFDPDMFETSGGIMYFADSEPAHRLIHIWLQANARRINQGKADDRVISLWFNTQRMMLPLNVIQLPIEYLWLTQLYEKTDTGLPGFVFKKHWKRENVVIEHPACLTGEERAAEQGASSNRNPTFYERVIDPECGRGGGIFYEYIFFPKKVMGKEFHEYLGYLENAKLDKADESEDAEMAIYRVRWNDYYGSKNEIAKYNFERAREIYNTFQKSRKQEGGDVSRPPIIYIQEISGSRRSKTETGVHRWQTGVHIWEVKKEDMIPVALVCWLLKQDFMLLPKGYDTSYIHSIIKQKDAEPTLEFITVAENRDNNPLRPVFSQNAPIYGSSNSRILFHLLAMCRTTSDISKIFYSSFIFLTRIRCAFINPLLTLSKDVLKGEELVRRNKLEVYMSHWKASRKSIREETARLALIAMMFQSKFSLTDVIKSLDRVITSRRKT